MLQQANASPSRLRITIAWLAILPASNLSSIVYRAASGRLPPSWLGFLDLAVLALLLGLTWALQAWWPLRGYLLSLAALAAGELLAGEVRRTFESSPPMTLLFANTIVELIPCAFLAVSVIGSGLSRRNLFLAIGELRAPARLPRGLPAVPWTRFGPFLMILLAAGLALQLALTVRPDPRLLTRALAALPLALAFAAINAAQEEFRFRAVLLARLLPLVGTTHALLIPSLLFGLGHWFGHPSGPSGVLLAGFAGWLWAKSMVETRGFLWAWLIHGFQDVVIVAFLAAAR